MTLTESFASSGDTIVSDRVCPGDEKSGADSFALDTGGNAF